MEMKKLLLYISCIAAAVACHGRLEPAKTPLEVAAVVNDAMAVKAGASEFEAGDSFKAYLRHVKWDGGTGEREVVNADGTPLLANFTVQSEGISPLLYWDDFSEDGKGDELNISTEGHYLQSYYAYCYNGGTPESALVPESGVLDWSVPYDQSALNSLQPLDLLWSKEQDPISYNHGNNGDAASHGILTIPFTHAMSMVSIIVKAGEGFGEGALNNSNVELEGMMRSAVFTAPQAIISSESAGTENAGKVRMKKVELSPDGKTCTYRAIVAPHAGMSEGKLFLKVYDAEKNDYALYLTRSILKGWEAGLTDGKMQPGYHYQLQPGYHYQLTATVNKAGIECRATISDWITLSSEAKADITFSTDLSGITTDSHPVANGSYDLYRGTSLEALSNESTVSFDGTSWSCSPAIYWKDALTSYYFRGLASFDGTRIASVNGANDVTAGLDLLWATTPAHSGTGVDGLNKDIAEGAAIDPRTSEVPLRFEHAMSRVKFTLVSSTGADAVDLKGAEISIAGMLKNGVINVVDGNISPEATEYEILTGSGEWNIVIPQNLEGKILSIKLADSTTYSLRLSECRLSGSETAIESWERGHSYEYTLTLTKEAISFRALVKDWVPVSGSGQPSLDW